MYYAAYSDTHFHLYLPGKGKLHSHTIWEKILSLLIQIADPFYFYSSIFKWSSSTDTHPLVMGCDTRTTSNRQTTFLLHDICLEVLTVHAW